jgi:NADH:ubiquinone reductase (H+-translocating)
MSDIFILDGGYTGMAAAVSVAACLKRRADVRVTLVNAQRRFTERLRLH